MLADTRIFRADIEGLRALAVTLVLLYHIELRGFSGGYVGVDVFFVLSGFLITSLLYRELSSTGTIGLREFYARRVRRLLPASLLVMLLTLVVAWVRWSPLEMMMLRKQAMATAAYLANVYFAWTGTDYLAVTTPPAFQHYWSLAVEEQFYLVWPVVMLALAWVARRRGLAVRTALLGGLGAMVALSFGLCVLLTATRQPWAFFLLPTRGWELASGGLLALALHGRARPSKPVATAVGGAGLGLVIAATVAFGGETPFPGWLAAVPVTGTLLLLWAGNVETVIGRALRVRVAQAVGRRSYAIYLWHWPLLLFTDGLEGGELPLLHRFGVLALTIALSFASYRFFENPIRYNAWLARRPQAGMAAGAGLSALAMVAAFAVTVPQPLSTGIVASELASGIRVAQISGGEGRMVPRNLTPSLADARKSLPLPHDDGCHRHFFDVEVADGCDYGDVDAERTMVLFGDSHGAHWFPALELVARRDGWRLVSLTKSSCRSYTDATQFSPELGRPYTECDRWREAVTTYLEELEPDLVVLANRPVAVLPGGGDVLGITRMLERLAALPDARVVMLGPSPVWPFDVTFCLSDHLDAADVCTAEKSEVVDLSTARTLEALATSSGVGYVDLLPWLCTESSCPGMVGHLLIYRDKDHLTPAFTRAAADELWAQIRGRRAEVLAEGT